MRLIFLILFLPLFVFGAADQILRTNKIDLRESGGSNKITLSPPTLSSDYTLTLPTGSGTANQVLITDGSGSTSWAFSSSGINYISSNAGAEANTSGWATYADAAGSAPVNGTAGSPTLTWTRSTSSPLRGSASFLLTKDAVNRQGEGASFDFTIDSTDQAKVLQVYFDYKVASGTYADSDLTVYLYDVTNALIIQPTGYSIQNAGVSMKQSATFQTASNSTSYRLIIHCASTSASAYTVQFDNFSVGPQIITQGTPVTDLTTATTEVVLKYGSTTATNITSYSTQVSRTGDRASFSSYIVFSGSANANGDISLVIPNGMTIDTSKAATTLKTYPARYYSTTNNKWYSGFARINDSTSLVFIRYDDAGSTLSTWQGNTTGASNIPGSTAIVSGDKIIVDVYDLPILSWSSSVKMSSETDTRVVAVSAKITGSQTGINPNNSAVKLTINTVTKDVTNTFDTANSKYVIAVPGWYRINAVTFIAATNVLNNIYYGSIYKNGSGALYGGYATRPVSSAFNLQVEGLLYLSAGDYLEFYLIGNGNNSASTIGTTSGGTYFYAELLSGPSQIAASETIVLKAKNTAGTSVANTGYTLIPFVTESKDSHGSWSTDTFTVQTPGDFQVDATINYASSTYAAGDYLTLVVYKNGSANSFGPIVPIGGAITQFVGASVSTILEDLVVGDTIKIYAFNNRTAGATLLSTTAGVNHLSITKVNR